MDVHPDVPSPRPSDNAAPTLNAVLDNAVSEEVQDLVAEFANDAQDEQDALDSISGLDSRMFEDLAALSNSIQAEEYELARGRSAQDEAAPQTVEQPTEQRQPTPPIDPALRNEAPPPPAAAAARDEPIAVHDADAAGPSTKRPRETTVDATEDGDEDDEGDRDDMDNDSDFGDEGKVRRRRNRAALLVCPTS